MANLRDIRKRISSVQSTKQITRTMEMVSTAKIRRALDRSVQSEPYKAALTDVMLTVAQDVQAAGDNPMLKRREAVRNGLVIAIASDRGLAGGFNVGVERAAERIMGEWERAGAKAQVITCGRKPSEYFRSHAALAMHFEGTSADPSLEEARMISSYVCRAYAAGELDRVVVVYHHAKNRVDQELRCETLLPLDPNAVAMAHGPRKNESEGPVRVSSAFKFVPSAERVLGELVPSYILTVIHQALIDSAAAEQGARRKAMHSATENATAIVATLTRTYNRVRQASITTEINEIVGGASALEEQQ
ncbi:ATP synthase F1 subunit gamma [Enorma sp.]|uniref:ATP synthase F1 subunit gamma n=1 Tax=Enorma sp. TaxID=1920692 RepID=UPI0025C302D0|nr:ATP synthase F1 subunit gamma [Enorma sp.]